MSAPQRAAEHDAGGLAGARQQGPGAPSPQSGRRGEPAVDQDLRCRDVARLVRGEEQNRVRDIHRISHFAGRALRVALIDQPLQVVGGDRLGQPMLDRAVCMRPGITVLQRIPFFAYEMAVDFEKAKIPSLVVE